MKPEDIEKIVNELVDESIETIGNYVNEYLDSSDEQMQNDIKQLKKDWIEKLSKIF